MSTELLFNCEKCHIKTNEDAVVCCLHGFLIANGYKCVGNGEQVSKDTTKKSDMLPSGWNSEQGAYSMLYQDKNSVNFVMKLLPVDGALLVHLCRSTDDRVTTMDVQVNEYTTSDMSCFDNAFQNLDVLEERFKKELLADFEKPAVQNGLKEDVKRRGDLEPDGLDPLRVPPRRPFASPYAGPDWGPRNPIMVGHNDLDPLGVGPYGGGGMLFDPMRSGGRSGPSYPMGIGGPMSPRGSVPYGARYDPMYPPDIDPSGGFNPYGRGRRTGPDPDAMLPPGFDDDMFM